MNDSPWGATPSPGRWGPPDQGPAPLAGSGYGVGDPAHRAHRAQTEPMPIVPGADGGDQENRDGHDDGHRLNGPFFRDERPGPPEPLAPHPPASGKKSAGRDLRAAVGVGAGLGAVILASLFLRKEIFVGVIAVAVVVGLWELTTQLAKRKQIRVPLVPLAIGGAAMVIAGYVRGAEGAWVAMALTTLAVLVWRMTEPPEDYLRDVTAGVFAAFYVPFLATFVALMLAADDGAWRVLTFLLLTVVSDTGAYAVGWKFGKHKLAPRISPGKTREGLLGAITFSMAAGALCLHFLIDGGTWWQGLLLGLAVAASATLGDLGESMIKRDLGIKDMGSLLPGHGGIMDRLDSLLPTAPVVWLLLVIFVGAG
ncbi:phosphatidate cytidylyltransferase [Streptomyces gobiensis]|uniref:phosphatidate cytidylyltransferase n=1 Tax=Streptomyces gobiensis TaxID=2875706 RepID=UPI001E646FE9|nr:phosphatidate cytidylyltransferase [Streptomyces gobiensis]UGY93847.1 phosphatidate cytidylyltransferase [Streptomyces gobiensis]